MSNTFVAFGELLIRLSATGGKLLESLPDLALHVGGAEANVCVGLARLGHETRMISVVPDNALGIAARDELRRWGVDTSEVALVPGRMGLYFLTPGAIHRPSDIVYDRAGSAFAAADFTAYDWSAALKGAGWLHVSGVTAALGEASFNAALAAMRAARAAGLKVSFDCNYRPKLWAAWGGDPVHMIPQLMAEADLIFGGHRDIELVSGQKFADARAAADHAFLTFPRLQRLVCTRREQVSADHNRLAGLMYTRDDTLETKMFEVAGIVDRIGGGDAFAAGVLHGLMRGETDAKALDYGIACGCLKHAQPGDLSLATAADLDGFLSDGGFDVRR